MKQGIWSTTRNTQKNLGKRSDKDNELNEKWDMP